VEVNETVSNSELERIASATGTKGEDESTGLDDNTRLYQFGIEERNESKLENLRNQLKQRNIDIVQVGFDNISSSPTIAHKLETKKELFKLSSDAQISQEDIEKVFTDQTYYVRLENDENLTDFLNLANKLKSDSFPVTANVYCR
jgi:hypothetical protein